jgi:putative transcriptional regulator
MKSFAFRSLLVVLLLVLALMSAATPSSAGQKPAQTYFLVAQPDLPDPMFRNSVVLMLPPTGTPLVIGLIVNKPTKLKLSELFPDDRALKQRSDLAYFGGPVDITTPLALVHTEKAPDGAVALFKDVYLSLQPRSIAGLLKDSPSGQSRLYLGRAQWTNDQLHNEMLENSWYNVASDPQYVFSADPATVWSTLVARAQAIETSAPRLRDTGPPALLRVTWPSPDMPGLDETPPDR